VHEGGRLEAEQPARRHDEALGAARQPRQRAEREGHQPAQQPGSDGDPDGVEAADRKPGERAENRRRQRAEESAELGRQGRVPEQVRGGEGTRSHEGALRQRRHRGEADAECEPGCRQREVGARGERVRRDKAAEQ
jgi:hypothetical protein